MRAIATLLASVALCALASSSAWGQARTSATEHRIALVIGNDGYQNVNKLETARADARAIAQHLERAGFEVMLKLDASEKAMKEAVRNFKARVNGGDVAIFYFSGHGVQLGAANYLLPVDIHSDNEEQIKDDSLPLQRIMDDLQEQKAKFSLTIVDACRDNPFKGTGKRALGGRGLAPTTAATGQMVFYSAGAGQQALDKVGPNDKSDNGLFTRVLLAEMDKPGVSVDRVLRNVRERVVAIAKTVNHEQVPAIYDQSLGDFYFFAADAPKAATRTLTQPGQLLRDCKDCPELVVVRAGSFVMGSSAEEQAAARTHGDNEEWTSRESPQHTVNLRGFAISRYTVTRGEFAAFVRAKGFVTDAERLGSCAILLDGKYESQPGYSWRNPGFAQGDNHPAVCISWNDAKAYLQWLRELTSKPYRLPTEAEREYAGRAGTQTLYWFGNSVTTARANYDGTNKFSNEPGGLFRRGTVPVNSFEANPFGLYNAHGNTVEWVEDCFHKNYQGAPTDGSAWTSNCTNNSKTSKSGSWGAIPATIRAAHRSSDAADARGSKLAFRVALSLEP
jgi:formylglycine-generating enzyme required for sulfatase activity